MRCLAVHGHRQDAEIFSQRIARLRGKLDKVGCELVFVNAPFRLPLDPGQKVPMRSWTDPAAGGADAPADWAPAHAFIDAAFAAHGQFDGVLGFSQGTAAIVSWLVASDTNRKKVRFAVLGCGSAARLPDGISNGGIHLASLHITGDNDTLVPRESSMRLAQAFDSAKAFFSRHKGRHEIAGSVHDDIVAFVRGHAIAQTPVPEHQLDELEALEAIFGDDYALLTRNPPECSVALRDIDTAAEADADDDTEGGDTGADDAGSVGSIRVGASVALVFALPPGYPEEAAPSIKVSGIGTLLPRADGAQLAAARKQLVSHLDDLAAGELAGEVMLFMLADEARAWFESNLARLRAGDGGGEEDEAPLAITAPFDEHEDEHRAFIKLATDEAARVDATAAPVEVVKKGEWEYCVGLVGKPSAGKSTLFNTVTKSDDAKVAAFPFTTIEPNIGVGYFAVAGPSTPAQLAPSPAHGVTSSGMRLEHVIIKDVAGLVPGCGGPAWHHRGFVSPCGFLPLPPAPSPARTCLPATFHFPVRCQTRGFRALLGGARVRQWPCSLRRIAASPAFLLQRACRGLGKGNAFLNDLLDADVLIHVLDASGATDKSGVKVTAVGSDEVGSGPTDDIEWVREEIHIWIFSNLARKWRGISNRPIKFFRMFSGYHCKDEVVHAALARVGVTEKDLAEDLPSWTAEFLHRIVAHFLRIRFPILLALNKIDRPKAAGYAQEAIAAFPYDTFVPLSAKLEFELQSWEAKGLIQYSVGTAHSAVRSVKDAPGWAALTGKERDRLLAAVALYADTAKVAGGSTGVLNAITKAVMLKPPLLVYAVDKFDTLLSLPLSKSRSPKVLSDAITMYPTSTAEDLYRVLKHKGAVSGDFVRAETIGASSGHGGGGNPPDAVAPSPGSGSEAVKLHSHSTVTAPPQHSHELRPMRKDERLSSAETKVFRILTNRKVNWQSPHEH